MNIGTSPSMPPAEPHDTGMPTFILVGAQKAGTTALYHCLNKHPDIFMSPHKEPYFFSHAKEDPPHPGPGDIQLIKPGSVPREREVIITREEDYRALFSGVNSEKAVGEASTEYLHSPVAAARIQQALPNVKCIAIFRNPIERAFSAYSHLRRDGREPCTSFAEALKKEGKRALQHWQTIWQYQAVGMYGAHWQRYVDRFPPEQLHTIIYDDFVADPEATLRKLFAFLEVDPDVSVGLKQRHNQSGSPRFRYLHNITNGDSLIRTMAKRIFPSWLRGPIRCGLMRLNLKPKPALSGAIRTELSESFRQDIELLSNLLGRDLRHWLK